LHKLRKNPWLKSTLFETKNRYAAISTCNKSAILVAISNFILYLVGIRKFVRRMAMVWMECQGIFVAPDLDKGSFDGKM
jgi:hypothetical protein